MIGLEADVRRLHEMVKEPKIRHRADPGWAAKVPGVSAGRFRWQVDHKQAIPCAPDPKRSFPTARGPAVMGARGAEKGRST